MMSTQHNTDSEEAHQDDLDYLDRVYDADIRSVEEISATLEERQEAHVS